MPSASAYTVLDETSILWDLTQYLRNSNILSTSVREVTTTTDNFTASNGQTTFTLDNSTVKNVREVTVDLVTQVYGLDYVVYFEGSNAGKVIFNTGLTVGEEVAIQYDHGSTDHIFDDFPRADISFASYPRISVVFQSSRAQALAQGGKADISDLMIDITAFDTSKYAVRSYLKAIREAIHSNNKSFYYFRYIRPDNNGPILKDPNRHEKILQKTDTYIIMHQEEIYG